MINTHFVINTIRFLTWQTLDKKIHRLRLIALKHSLYKLCKIVQQTHNEHINDCHIIDNMKINETM